MHGEREPCREGICPNKHLFSNTKSITNTFPSVRALYVETIRTQVFPAPSSLPRQRPDKCCTPYSQPFATDWNTSSSSPSPHLLPPPPPRLSLLHTPLLSSSHAHGRKTSSGPRTTSSTVSSVVGRQCGGLGHASGGVELASRKQITHFVY